jgi:CHRD domain
MRKTSLLATLVLFTFSTALVGCDGDDSLTELDGDENFVAELTPTEGPAQTGEATANGRAALELDDDELSVAITVGDLSSGVTAAYIHGPGTPNGTSNIIFDFTSALAAAANSGARSGTIMQAEYNLEELPVSSTGVLRVPPSTLVNYLATGQAFVTVRTVLRPAGEIGGQVRIE